MPIYAYKCADCGFQQDVMQKMSDAPLTDCPQCGKSSFGKQLTAAGIQLKGSGYYATDFKNGPAKPAEAPPPAEPEPVRPAPLPDPGCIPPGSGKRLGVCPICLPGLPFS